jgi:hypothetical protein
MTLYLKVGLSAKGPIPVSSARTITPAAKRACAMGWTRRQTLFFALVGLMGDPAPFRRVLPYLMELVLSRQIDLGRVFDLALPLAHVGEGYRVRDEHRAIKWLWRMWLVSAAIAVALLTAICLTKMMSARAENCFSFGNRINHLLREVGDFLLTDSWTEIQNE